MSNSFGNLFRITSFGESHGAGIGVVIDGCPAGVNLDFDFIQSELNRRKPGQSRITTQRKEADEFEVYSGLVNQVTTGAPLGFFVPNQNVRSGDYDHLISAFRPSHADYTYYKKYGIRDHRGGGRSSARETIARVIGGAIAKLFLSQVSNIQINAWVQSIHQISLEEDPADFSLHTEYEHAVKCPHPEVAEKMFHFIDKIRKEGDSVGGVVKCRVSGMVPGLGEPLYAKLPAELSTAMLSINAVKGFEIGSGFSGTLLKGSEHNDVFYNDEGKIRTKTNHSGGVQGGISNGEDLVFRVAFKPTSTIMRDQQSVDTEGNQVTLSGKGRHDPCVVPRAVPIVEAMAAIVLADQLMQYQARQFDGLKGEK
ncbi:MAG: chorismate synthase [Bacteroidetes bacterium]|nr:chorismate synthase [Bacteroidota bacterium]